MGKDLLYWASTLLDLSRKGLEKEIFLIRVKKMKLYF